MGTRLELMETQTLFEAVQQQAQARFAFVKNGPASESMTFAQKGMSVEYPLWMIRISTTPAATPAETAEELLKHIPSTEHNCGMYLTGVRIADEFVPKLGKPKRVVHLACFIVDEWCDECENASASDRGGSVVMVPGR